MASLFPSHFPTEFLTLFPPGRWHLSPPILTHSFLLATLCRTPATTSKLPTCLHGSMIGKGKDGCHFRPMAEQSGSSCTTRPCSGPTDQLRMALWKKGWMHHIRHTEKNHTSHGIIQQHKAYGVPTRAVTTVVMYHLCGYCVAFSWNVLTEALYSSFWQIPIHSQAFNNTC